MDKLEVFKTFDTFCKEGELFEIRAIHAVNPKTNIWSGYFKSFETAWNAIQPFDNEYNIYFVLNAINDVCYSMIQKDKMVRGAENTKDHDIIARRYVLIDLDCVRGGKKISSTKEELNQARMKAHAVRNYLRDQGFSFPVVACSGSGFHLCYKIDDWANTDENTKLLSRFLQALSLLFSDDDVKVDTVVWNAARVDKLYGTIARKGANTEERPHRLSKILLIPDEFVPTDKEYFKKVASFVPEEETKSQMSYANLRDYDNFNIDDFLSKHNIDISKDVVDGKIRKIVLKECPFNSEHKAPDSALFVMENGAIGFKCLHQSCSHYSFKDFRLKFEPDAYSNKEIREFRFKQKYYGNEKTHTPFVPLNETDEKGKKWLSMKDVKRVDISELLSIPTGYHELDKKIIGLFAGELSVLSGLNASGKTSWLNCITLNVIEKGFKTAIWSGEMQDWRFQNWMNQMAAGKGYVRKKSGFDNFYYTPQDVCDKIDHWLEGKLFLYNNSYGSKWEQLFNDVKEVVDNEGVQLVILDNLATLSIDGYESGVYANQTKFIIDLKEYAKQKNIHIILVAHPRKQNDFLRKEGISGTADLTNIADNVFLLHRVGNDFEKRAGEFFGKDKIQNYMDYSNIVEVAKNRQMGIVDHLVGMYYEVESRRLKNDIAEHTIYGWQEDVVQQELIYDDDTQYSGANIRDNNAFLEQLDEVPF